MRARTVPYLEPVTGILWWSVGAAALAGGPGTVVLAAGLGVTGVLVLALRRQGPAEPLPRGEHGRLWRILGVSAALMAVSGTLLGFLGGYGELAVPLSAVVAGVACLLLASTLRERAVVALGGALIVLGAVGALLALGSAGRLYPQGVVGLVAGGLVWLEGAYRSRLLGRWAAGLRERSRR